MNVIFTCGGTAGHVNPALALAGYMKERLPELRVLFVGTPDGMERGLVEKSGYDFRGVEISNFQRSLKPAALGHNLQTAKRMVTSRRQARAILAEFRPDLVVGTGGYASYPMIRSAAKAGIPTAVHESNMVPGLTTRMLEKYTDRIMVGFEECRAHYRRPDKVAVTGTPVRGDFFALTHDEARQRLGFSDDRPLVVSFWGSLGASGMNAQMLDFFRREQAEGEPFHHIHAVGRGGWEKMKSELAARGLDRCPSLDVREYIYDMAVVMRAADLVICRAGASTVSEVTALAVPTVIVPSPYVVNNHQEKNARILEQHGGAVLLLESECTGDKLYEAARGILSDPSRRAVMSRGMASLGILDATERIYDTVMALVK
ncbi:MAG: undecaprenyldiphospho-muramoylpentapeptide beta-N-acetylglucosaminyltransferase [Ruminococcaceae bacterium]|jgi:UDP-N-acetylglucosamine--N-acetylmuramyl-(pentapeptide) pyrophosphoryl-undecaprenol N-acetylglucosamine transferase|nr:undecaprenyldiphospho-muramoylpentapeptide beta-N-acetylglucosaminyltransferase [Oscillospiraceae bacterium]